MPHTKTKYYDIKQTKKEPAVTSTKFVVSTFQLYVNAARYFNLKRPDGKAVDWRVDWKIRNNVSVSNEGKWHISFVRYSDVSACCAPAKTQKPAPRLLLSLWLASVLGG